MSAEQSTITYKDIPGFPGYRVGDDGSVWSRRARGHRGILRGVWVKLGGSTGRAGRQTVCLRPNTKYTSVARLVLEVFVGPCPEGMEACHFPDRNPRNNRLSNLRWDTRKANQADRIIHGTALFGETHPCAKVLNKQATLIRSEFRSAKGNRRKAPIGLLDRLAAKHGLSRTQIKRIARGDGWSHLTDPASGPGSPSPGSAT